jgi:hypothetical protein
MRRGLVFKRWIKIGERAICLSTRGMDAQGIINGNGVLRKYRYKKTAHQEQFFIEEIITYFSTPAG